MTTFDPRRYWEDRLEGTSGVEGVASLDASHAYNMWAYRVRRRVFARTVRSLGIDLGRARVLDVGSGTGFYLDAWRKLGARDVTGSDLTSVATDALRRRFDGPIVQMDISDAPDIGPFDVISVMDVLFHIVDDERYAAAFRNLASLLAPGGVLVFSEHLPRDVRKQTAHRVSRTLDRVEHIARDAGFSSFVRRPMFVHMEYPIDPVRRHGHLRRWRTIERLARRRRAGAVLGAVLYPIEVASTVILRESPSSEIGHCRRASCD
jgi:SAM-dependent methyltransferase